MVVLGDETRDDDLVGKGLVNDVRLITGSRLQLIQRARRQDTVTDHGHRLCARFVRIEGHDLPGHIDGCLGQGGGSRDDVLQGDTLGECLVRHQADTRHDGDE